VDVSKVRLRVKHVKTTFRIVLKTKPILSLSHVMASVYPIAVTNNNKYNYYNNNNDNDNGAHNNL